MSLLQKIKSRPTRPFANAHWTLAACFVVLWELLIFAQVCNEGPYYLEVCVATVTVIVSFWVGDSSGIELAGWDRFSQIVGSAMYDLLTLFLLVLIISFPIVMVTPTYQCYTPRARVSELLLTASGYRTVIAERVEKQKSLKGVGEGLTVKIVGRVTGGAISPDGTITITGDDPVAIVVMRPSLESGELKWKCGGFPHKLLPASCREFLPF